MENARSTVVPIRQAGAQMTNTVNKQNPLRLSAKLLKEYLQKKTGKHLEEVRQQMFIATDVKGMGSLTVDIKTLHKASQHLSAPYLDDVMNNLTIFSNNLNSVADNTLLTSKEVGDFSDLQLVAIDEIENQLLLDDYVANCEGRLADVLYALQQRMEFVVKGKTVKGSNNPFGPYVLLNTYVELIKGEPFSKEEQKILCESFAKSVLTDLGDVLAEINNLFIQANVLATLPKQKIKRSNSVAKKEATSYVHETVPRVVSEPAQNKCKPILTEQSMNFPAMQASAIEPGLYSSLVEMAQAFRTQGGDKVVSDGLRISGEQLPTTELIDALTDIQKTGAIDGVERHDSVRMQIGTSVQLDGQRRPYAEQDDTLIDVVAMFFDVILQDRHLPDVVRAMIAQLQIPILKVAMIDKEFFAKKSHPARRFLNGLSQAGLGVSEKNQQIRSAVFEKMEELVARVLMDFDSDVDVFAELVEEFDVFMEQQQRQMDVIEERSRKVTKGSEQLELTKRQAAYEISLCLKGKSIPEFVKLFLDDAWHDVLVLALLRHEKEPAETKQCIDVMERLVNSVSTTVDDNAKAAIVDGLARLLKDIKVGLENISYDFHESAPFFKELETWHRGLFSASSNKSEDTSSVVIVEIDDDICMKSLEEDLLQQLESELSHMPDDKFSKRANKMQVGDWVEYKSVEGAKLRAKLSWKSAVTLQCLFVNDHGAKALDISVVNVADELRQKRMSIVGQENSPLVERVLQGMKKLLMPKDAAPSTA